MSATVTIFESRLRIPTLSQELDSAQAAILLFSVVIIIYLLSVLYDFGELEQYSEYAYHSVAYIPLNRAILLVQFVVNSFIRVWSVKSE